MVMEIVQTAGPRGFWGHSGLRGAHVGGTALWHASLPLVSLLGTALSGRFLSPRPPRCVFIPRVRPHRSGLL